MPTGVTDCRLIPASCLPYDWETAAGITAVKRQEAWIATSGLTSREWEFSYNINNKYLDYILQQLPTVQYSTTAICEVHMLFDYA